ncbi:MAG: hypothetical protein A2091_13750 [Desulfuromonadales bacterium GWD2_61_12]|nr:MAG: hypothetical protein A2005_05985 [Desulfuromonadales bacterium GWC2_61_20]OGR36489.1 MAG: hypothetical protein A2091_13750 [Desulfuromonadales bacterium GWD2_61_12]
MKQLLYGMLVVFCLLLAGPLVAGAAEGKAGAPEGKAQAAVATVNINSATVKELENLPGIGKTTALNIVDYRTANGPFKTRDDLLKVKGVGEKTMEKVRQLVAVQ